MFLITSVFVWKPSLWDKRQRILEVVRIPVRREVRDIDLRLILEYQLSGM